MARVTPLTVRVEESLSEARRGVVKLALRNGHIDSSEQEAIDRVDDALAMVRQYDLARRAGAWIQETGTLPDGYAVTDLSPWLQRQWAEAHQDVHPLDAA